MDTEKQRQHRRDDARLIESGNARSEQLNTRGAYRVTKQQSLACLSGSDVMKNSVYRSVLCHQWSARNVCVLFACDCQGRMCCKSVLVLIWKVLIMWVIWKINAIIKSSHYGFIALGRDDTCQRQKHLVLWTDGLGLLVKTIAIIPALHHEFHWGLQFSLWNSLYASCLVCAYAFVEGMWHVCDCMRTCSYF